MADNSFKIVARLDVPASVGAIINDIPKLEKTLRANKEGNVKIVAGLDPTRSTKLIQNQLNAIINQTNAPTIKVGVDIGQNNAVQGIVGGLKEVQNQAQVSTNKLTNLIDKFKQPIKPILNNEGLIDADKTIAKVQQHFQELGKVSVRGIYSDKEAVDSLDKMVVSLKNGQQEARTLTFELDKAGKAFYLTGGTSDNSGIQKFIESTQKLQDKTKALRINLTSDLKTIRSAWQDVNGGKSVTSDENIAKLNQQYIKTAQAIRDLHKADSTTMTSMKANAQAEISALKQMVTQFHNAEKVATDLREKGFNTVKINTGNNIDKFINSINNSKVPIQAMQTEIDKLTKDFAELDTIQDQAGKSAALTNILNTLDNAQTKFQSLKELFKGFGNANWFAVNSEQINKISDMATKVAIYKQYLTSTRDEWKTQGIYVGEIQSKMASLARSLPNIKKPEKFDKWVSEWNELNQQAINLKANLDEQVVAQNKIYEIQSKIASLNPNKDANKIANLNNDLKREQETLSNLQGIANVYTKLVSYEEQDKYITEQTVKARQQLNNAVAGQADKAIQQRTADMKSYQKQIETAISSLNQLNNSTVFSNNSSNPQVTQTKQEIANLITEYQKLYAQLQANPTSQGLESLRTELTNLDSKMKSTMQSAEAFENQLKTDNSANQLARRVQVLKSQIEAYAHANSKAKKQFGGQFNDMLSVLNNSPDKATVDNVAKQFQTIRQEINKADLAGKTFFQRMKESIKKFSSWMSMTYLLSTLTRTIRSMVTSVVELDTALVDLKKTFGGTEYDLKNLYITANQTAKELGVTTKEILEQASAWSRLGYSSAEAAETMAKNSAIFKSISPGMDIDMATDGLVSMMKAFDIEANDVLDGIMSKVNVVGNKFATDNTAIVEAMTRSSSAMAAANNTLEETIALNTASIEITRNAETTATAWRTVSMRLRGYDEETEELSDDLKTITGDIANLTKTASNGGRGISLFTDESKETYKSTYQIIKEIAEIWDELSDKNQAELLEKLAGKRNSQVVSAAINNFASAEKAIDEMANSQGNAMAEMEIAYGSIAYKVNEFKESLVGLGQTVFEQDTLKWLIDKGTTIIEVLDKIVEKIGLLPTILGSIASVNIFKNIGSPKMFGLVLKLPIVICVL